MKYQLAFGLMTATLLAANVFAEEAAESKGPEVTFSGEVEFDAYTGDLINDDGVNHSFATTADVNVNVKFNDQWSAEVQFEADGKSTDPASLYNGAFIQYTKSEDFVVKAGDLTFSEGAFVNYYDYDDPADNAAGMSEHDIRGVEVDFKNFVFGLGFGRGDNDNSACVEDLLTGEEVCESGRTYDAHVAYELALGEQVIRPYVDYKSYQEEYHNELHAGVEATLKFGMVGLHAVYGLHMDNLGEDEPGATHAFLVEPSVELGALNVKGSVFYAYFDDDAPIDHGDEIPEYFFAYVEPSYALLDFLTLGVPVEFHSGSTDVDDDVSTFDLGVRAYFAPVENLEITGFAMMDIPLGDDCENEDVGLKFGVETVFDF